MTGEQRTLALVRTFSDSPAPAPAPDIHLGVLRAAGEYGLIACEPVRAGERLFVIHGEPTGMPSQHSMQVGKNVHLDLPDGTGLERIMDHYFWWFLNHSCAPNTRIEDRQVIAIADIRAGEEITFHYNTTEFAIAEPFDCWCGSTNCVGRVGGFSSATAAEREGLRPWLAKHLLTADTPPVGDVEEPAVESGGR
ncbi:SET domain-containing protein-lysine N-methyltransferase [Streptomyces roseoverticillatus]|uniref:SET domain-containing protein-lysine N-methyltransferase n=1 Tax=Streptomyces roseoverticillatus TaxID=66429 RepID=UPI0033E3E18F